MVGQTALGDRHEVDPSIRVLDLFSGAGGLTEGFRLAGGFRTVRAVENDLAAAASYQANHPDVVYRGGIEDWLREEEVPPVDVIVGGPPCQGFSTLGKQDAEDARNRLWEQYAETIRRASPKYFVVENVAAFMTSHQFEQFLAETAKGGSLASFAFEAAVLNAADYGAAQVRRRAVLVGHHRDLPFPGFPIPTHARDQWVPVKKVLAGLPEAASETELPRRKTQFEGQYLPGTFNTNDLHLSRRYEEMSLERFGYIPPGGNRFDIPDRLLSPCWRRHKSGSADVMGRLRWDRPSVTIRTEFFKPEKGRYLHPTEHRAITHHEAARIQGFRDDYQWVGSKTSIARQIGNAVPIPLGMAIGRTLQEAAK